MKAHLINKCTLGCAALAAVSIAVSAWAQDCPKDLTFLRGQIRTPGIKPPLAIPIDRLVASAGGLDQAVRGSKVQLLCFMNAKARFSRQPRSKEAQKVDDAILVTKAAIKALECRKLNPDYVGPR